MQIEFSKMHGIGNDFVVIDAVRQSFTLTPDKVRAIADRHFGIGCDQVLLVEPPRSEDVAFRYRILNADGSEVLQCGNGARCFARFVHQQGLTTESEIPVETGAGQLILKLQDNGQVEVNMGEPELEPEQIPFNAPQRALIYNRDVLDQAIAFSALSMGNPHAVLTVDAVASADVEKYGAAIEVHPDFPERVNVGFMQIEAADHIRLRVFERGVGETLACGSGACAAVVAGQLQGRLDQQVKVDLPGGRLIIEWQGEGSPVFMTGPAETVYEGKIEL